MCDKLIEVDTPPRGSNNINFRIPLSRVKANKNALNIILYIIKYLQIEYT